MFLSHFFSSHSIPRRLGPVLALAATLFASAGCNEMLGIRLGRPLDDDGTEDEDSGNPSGGSGATGGSGGGTSGTGSGGSSGPGGSGGAGGGSGAGGSSGSTVRDASVDMSTNDARSNDAATCTKNDDCWAYEHVQRGAPVTCMDGKCRVPDSSCVVGWAHCSSKPDEFCETDVTTPQRCGSCNNACTATLPLCRDGACTSSCVSPKPDQCDGMCVDTKSDLKHCGKCNQECAFPNADATCSNGECKIGVCHPGYGDCTAAAGCETRLNTLSNCGACNTPCAGDAGDIASCETGTCVATCVRKGPEDCYNGVDDDCDGKLDCEDSDCTPTSICEPVGTAAYGTTVGASESCPTGFNSPSSAVLYGGFSVGAAECTGCSCVADCAPIVITAYSTPENCTANVQSGSAFITQPSAACGILTLPTYTAFTAKSSRDTPGCIAQGPATRVAPTWTDQKKFCAAPSSVGGGCQSGFSCVPKPPVTACLMSSGDTSCGAGYTAQNLYTGYSDARQCGCECSPRGACSDLLIDTSPLCDKTDIGALSTKKCVATSSSTVFNYSFPPGNSPTCENKAYVTSGSATPTGAATLCCRQP